MTQQELEHYLLNFYGYGQWASDFYFIGIEEGGGGNPCLVDSKLSSFLAFMETKDNLVDNYTHQMTRIPVLCREGEFFINRIQPTWKPFIKILLTLSGLNPHPADAEILHYQVNSWGRVNSEPAHAVLELLPLPSPGLTPSHWQYDLWTNGFPFPYHLVARQQYINLIFQERINHLAVQINYYKPRLVIFYAKSNPYLTFCKQIVSLVSPLCAWNNLGVLHSVLLNNGGYRNYNAEYCKVTHDNGSSTLFVMCNQPAGVYGNPANYFDSLTIGIQPLI